MLGSANPLEVKTTERLWAVVSPVGRDGLRWVDYSSIGRTAKAAKETASRYWRGGWPDLRKRGWSVVRIKIVPVE